MKRLWCGLLVLILISPLGLILPGVFKSGAAWGEWGTVSAFCGEIL